MSSLVRLNPINRQLMTLVRSSDQQFLPAALEILETPVSPARIIVIWTICCMLATALVWSCIAKLDIYAVAPGRVQPGGRSKVVQPFDLGKVAGIYVQNGSQVKPGDLLVQLDPTEAIADRRSAATQLAEYDAEVPRRKAAIEDAAEGRPCCRKIQFPEEIAPQITARAQALFDAEMAQHLADKDKLRAQIDEKKALKERLLLSMGARQKLISVLNERLQMKEMLVQRAAGTRKDVLDAQQQVESEMTNLAFDKGQLLEAEAAAVSLERQVVETTKQFIATQSQKLEDAERKQSTLRQDLVKAEAKLERTRLIAPIEGTVQQLAITTVGQVLTAGQAVMVIVPDTGPIEVEALVRNEDIGFVAVGQEAVIKLDAFPFSRFGTVGGKVIRVSRDAVANADASASDASSVTDRTKNNSATSAVPKTQDLVFPITVELDRRSISINGTEMPISLGLTLTAEVRTGERRVIDYFLSPLRELVSQSAHER